MNGANELTNEIIGAAVEASRIISAISTGAAVNTSPQFEPGELAPQKPLQIPQVVAQPKRRNAERDSQH